MPKKCNLTGEEILDLLARDDFISLRNYGNRWGISHKPFNGGLVAEIVDASLDRLIESWGELAASTDEAEEEYRDLNNNRS